MTSIDDLTALADRVAATGGMLDLSHSGDGDLMGVLAAVGLLQRRVEAILIDAVGEVAARSDSPFTADRLTTRLGCHDVNELTQRATRVAPGTAARLIRAARAVCGSRAAMSGEVLEPDFPALRAALLAGELGVDGLVAATGDLQSAGRRITREQRHVADDALAAAAAGTGVDAAPQACADLLRIQGRAWAAAFDQDGAAPTDRIAQHRRGLAFGTPTGWGTPIRGMLLNEVAAQFQHLYDAIHNPRVTFDDTPELDGDAQDAGPGDPRTRAQKNHDLLATVLTVAAASRDLPTIGGAAPTLVVSVREEDLRTDTGHAYTDATGTPVPLATARHTACAGSVQRITLDPAGRIHRIGTEQRVFTRHQRRAIALRDGGCLIPGCGIPAAWCEIHHVIEHARGGPTHTDNGVLLCWHHHRHLDSNGWTIRIRTGIPEVKAPPWWDPTAAWRPTTTSPTRLHTRTQQSRLHADVRRT